MIFFAHAIASASGSATTWLARPELDRPLGLDPHPGQGELLGLQQADLRTPHQRTTVSGYQTDLHVRVGEVRGLGDVDDVGQRGQAAAQPDGRAIDRGDHRDAAAQHADDEVAAVLDGLLPQRLVVAKLVEVVEVAAGRERPARTGDYCRPCTGVLVERLPDLGQPHVQVVVDGVERIGPVERDDAQRAVGLDVDFVWHVVHFILLSRGCAKR